MSDVKLNAVPSLVPIVRQRGRAVRLRIQTGCADGGIVGVSGICAVRKGDIAELFIRLTPQSGTVTLSCSPTPTVTLSTQADAPLVGLCGLPASYYNAGSGLQGEANFLLDTGNALLVPGTRYAGKWTVCFTCSGDGAIRKETVPFLIDIIPPLG